jgi:hypothetical protein
MANRRKTTDDAATAATAPTAASAAQVEAPAENTEESVELTVNDLAAIKQIIDVASSRGCFRPNEMVAIGTTYARLENFLNAVSQQQAQTPQAG